MTNFQHWRLDTETQTLILASRNKKLPFVVYWGSPLPSDEDINILCHADEQDITGGMIDANPDLSICPEASATFSGQAGLTVRDINGKPILTQFHFMQAKQNNDSLKLKYRDAVNSMTYIADFTTFSDTAVIAATATIQSDAAINLQWLAAPVMPAPSSSVEMIDFSGRWCGELQQQSTPWNAGARLRENFTGRSGHEHYPGLFVPIRGAVNCAGKVYGFHYGYSGGHRMVAEELPDGRRQVQFGNASNIEHKPVKEFTTATLYLNYSDHGLNGNALSFQRHVKKHIIATKPPRPVHYNCWEAVYFDHSYEKLMQIASKAAALGAERFVLDDGWFGTRDDDTQSLGDWQIDPRKYPDGLTPLIDHVQSLGMSFGIWFEPEMINPNSDIYRNHPEWLLGSPDQTLGRQQMVLNMSLPEVQAYLYNSIANILNKNAITYIKWDHNRVLPYADADQIRGTYALLSTLRRNFPDVEIESCASGGGRIDFGILDHTQRVWLSDSNDAIERAKIQHNAALFLPAMVTGSHVGPKKCHTSGREINMHFRAWIAAQRHMGFEMNPNELTQQETQILKHVTNWWKQNRDWMMLANIHLLDSDDNAVIAEQHISENTDRFVVFANKIDTSKQIAPRPLRFTGLDANQYYNLELTNKDEIHTLSRGNPLLKSAPLKVSGQYLMQHGVHLPWSFPAQCWVLEGLKS